MITETWEVLSFINWNLYKWIRSFMITETCICKQKKFRLCIEVYSIFNDHWNIQYCYAHMF